MSILVLGHVLAEESALSWAKYNANLCSRSESIVVTLTLILEPPWAPEQASTQNYLRASDKNSDPPGSYWGTAYLCNKLIYLITSRGFDKISHREKWRSFLKHLENSLED